MQRRIVIVEKEKCNPEGCGGFLCARVSPSNRAGKEAFYRDEDGKVGVNEELVSDVDQVAVHKCPFGALRLVKLPASLEEEPVHRYGKNGFSLYRLPIPRGGRVVGMIGRNGIGKSTAVKILAGILKPNLGREGGAGMREVINHFKGSEAQAYFEKLRDGRVSLSYKPQQVEELSKRCEGRVGELLSRVKKSGEEYERIVDELQLRQLLDRELGVLSGGELQRVAMAAAALKGASVTFFDEPTSYLDVKQRLRAAAFLQGLARGGGSVVLIDHDLIILDYVSELVHILYGQENAYGIVSQPKATKAGINVYLAGYLREENLRFRAKPISFARHATRRLVSEEPLASWPVIERALGSFRLTASPGRIHKGEIIGVLGENGTGKTSFVRELARMSGEEKLTISYKPQYLGEAEGYDPELVVGSFLAPALKYEHQLLAPLNLQPLLEKRLGSLSGGQLQSVLIARCLATPADLYLLDEPSAYLDVEQRLAVSRAIREVMEVRGGSAFIVDHDLLFLDYVSDKLVVFEGEPGRRGAARGPFPMEEGMNRFLSGLGVTFRRDEENNRPRANKPGSVKDREQKASGKLYYAG